MVTRTDISKITSRLANRMLPPMLRADARRLINSLRIDEFQQDNFTIVTLTNGSRVLGTGASKRMPTDINDDAIGYNLALVRAVRSVIETHILAV